MLGVTGFTGPTSKNGQSGSFITGARECHLVIDQNFVWMFEQRIVEMGCTRVRRGRGLLTCLVGSVVHGTKERMTCTSQSMTNESIKRRKEIKIDDSTLFESLDAQVSFVKFEI